MSKHTPTNSLKSLCNLPKPRPNICLLFFKIQPRISHGQTAAGSLILFSHFTLFHLQNSHGIFMRLALRKVTCSSWATRLRLRTATQTPHVSGQGFGTLNYISFRTQLLTSYFQDKGIFPIVFNASESPQQYYLAKNNCSLRLPVNY